MVDPYLTEKALAAGASTDLRKGAIGVIRFILLAGGAATEVWFRDGSETGRVIAHLKAAANTMEKLEPPWAQGMYRFKTGIYVQASAACTVGVETTLNPDGP